VIRGNARGRTSLQNSASSMSESPKGRRAKRESRAAAEQTVPTSQAVAAWGELTSSIREISRQVTIDVRFQNAFARASRTRPCSKARASTQKLGEVRP